MQICNAFLVSLSKALVGFELRKIMRSLVPRTVKLKKLTGRCRNLDVNTPSVGRHLAELRPKKIARIGLDVGGRSPIVRVKMAASLHYVSFSFPRRFCVEFCPARPLGL